MSVKITVDHLLARKTVGPKIVMLTSYDYPTARMEDACGIDVQLVGDSVGTNVLGYGDVSEVTVDDMIHHVKAVSRGARRSFVLCDMPYRSFETPETALRNARRCIDAGADGVKMEGEEEVLEQTRRVASAGVPVCAHIGYTPQSDGAKARVQGKDLARARELIVAARRAQEAGAFMVVLELIPQQLASEITHRLTIPTIGIGAGKFCDGQVQVVYDIAGMSERIYRHAKAYAHLAQDYSRLLASYIEETRDGSFPTDENASSLPDDVLRGVREWLETGQG
jgi:3-methyl-2-oxobutanoate hydroxymethyltransferase